MWLWCGGAEKYLQEMWTVQAPQTSGGKKFREELRNQGERNMEQKPNEISSE